MCRHRRSTDTLEYIINVGHYDSNLQNTKNIRQNDTIGVRYRLEYKAEADEKAECTTST